MNRRKIFVALALLTIAAAATSPASAQEKEAKPPPGAARPAWIDRPAGLHGGTYETKVLVGPEATRETLDRATTEAVRLKILEYLTSLGGAASTEAVLRDEARLRSRVIGEQWEERVKTASGEARFLHTQLRFDSRLQNEWQAAAKHWSKEARSRQLVVGFLKGMWIVLLVHVALRIDARKPRPVLRVAVWTATFLLAAAPWACGYWEENAVATPLVVPAGATVEIVR